MYLEIIALPDSNLSPIAFAGMMPWRIAATDVRVEDVDRVRDFIDDIAIQVEEQTGREPSLRLTCESHREYADLLDGIPAPEPTPNRAFTAREVAAHWLDIDSVERNQVLTFTPLEQAAASALRAAANSIEIDGEVATVIHLHLPLERTNLARPVQMAGLKMCECVTEVPNGT